MLNHDFKKQLLEKARQAGFLDVRVAQPEIPLSAKAAYNQWLEAGFQGEMGYMENHRENRLNGVEHILPGTRSVLVFACSYYSSPDQDINPASGGEVQVAKYALGRDYHLELRERLHGVVNWLDTTAPGHNWRVCVDSAPLLERTYAAASGIGFIGKNGMVISWMAGSYTFLAEILTTAEIEPDVSIVGTCGNCTRCIDACPTAAIVRPGVLDARLCISYLTIEKKTELTTAESASTGSWAFGCDICQDVCPYNKHPARTSVEAFQPGVVVNQSEPASTFLEPSSNRQFERRFQDSPILRAGKRRIQKLVRDKLPEDQ